MTLLLIMLAYLSGSVSGSLLLGKFRGVDIREQGSGNAGGTNALRTQGAAFAFGVVLIDIGKGALAATLPWLLENPVTGLAEACGFAAIVGHCYPLWHGFRGGKGAGTLIGVLLVLAPLYLLAALLVWLLTLVISGYVGLSTILAVAALVPIGWLDSHSEAALRFLLLASALLIVFTHRGNIRRLRQGRENRFQKARIVNWFKHE